MCIFRILEILLLSLILFCKAEDMECEDLHDWCETLGSSYCDRSEDMRTFCPKTCNLCFPIECKKCEQNCTVNGDGTIHCSCFAGYELMKDGKSCGDIDECSKDIDVCLPHQMCRNYPGEFECLNDKCVIYHSRKYFKSWSREGTCCKWTNGECGKTREEIYLGRTIIGGRGAPRGQWPWHALMIIDKEVCSGSLINMEWVVSAAHCFESKNITSGTYRTYFGVTDMTQLQSPVSQSRTIAEVITHENYNFPRNDIALVRLDEPLQKSDFVGPVCLPNGEVPDVGIKCFTTGFGFTATGSERPSTTLQQDMLPIVDGDVCRRAHDGTRDIHVDEMICAGYQKGGKDACRSDSGGPLVCQRCDSCDWFLAGVASFGEGCALEDFYGVYTNVVNYENWIESKVSSVKITKKKCQPIEWGQWREWESCDKPCGTGMQNRTRICRNGEPGLPGCLGSDIESKRCNTNECRTDSWTKWTVCSKTCGKGEQTRKRLYVTSSCKKRTKIRECNTQECPSWSPWSMWGDCTKDCDVGNRTRTRQCLNGNIGDPGCHGTSEEQGLCNTKPCPRWSYWSNWTECSVPCDGGSQTSRRSCKYREEGRDCVGSSIRKRICNTVGCFGLCDKRCRLAVSWGYCSSEKEWMGNFCQIDCCRPSVCRDTASRCSVSERWRCRDPKYHSVCVATCGGCPQ